MTLPVPELDDKTFEELIEEAKKLIPIYTDKWTDHNIHDPGITFIELFSWIAETQIYRLNRIPDRHLLKFLTLLKSRPQPAVPSKADIQFTSTSGEIHIIEKHTQLKSNSDNSAIIFETDEKIEILPAELKSIVSYSDYQLRDVTEFNKTPKTFYYAFGELPAKDNALYVGIYSEKDLTGRKVRLGIYLFEKDLPSIGKHGDEKLNVYPSAKAQWEYWNGAAWQSLTINSSEEIMLVLSKSGIISFDFPSDIKKDKPAGLNKNLFWIRCRLLEAEYEIPPKIDRILLNVVTATQAETKSKTFKSSGMPYQVLKAKADPIFSQSQEILTTEDVSIVPGSHKVEVGGKDWIEANDFDAAGPDDKHYAIDLFKGEIYFGDGINGCVPEKDEDIKVDYRECIGKMGNVSEGTVSLQNVLGVTASNPFPAYGGNDAESIEEAFIRFRKDLKIPYSAVTAKDYEFVAVNTPGLKVERANASVTSENTVTVVVVPYSPLKKPFPGKGFLKTVCRHLDMHRLITTQIAAAKPDYVKVSVYAEVTIKSGSKAETVKDSIKIALDRFLSPIKRIPDDNEWEFGRPVYRSEVYELLENVEGVNCVLKPILTGEEGIFKYTDGNIEIGKQSLVYSGEHNISILETQMICKRGVRE